MIGQFAKAAAAILSAPAHRAKNSALWKPAAQRKNAGNSVSAVDIYLQKSRRACKINAFRLVKNPVGNVDNPVAYLGCKNLSPKNKCEIIRE